MLNKENGDSHVCVTILNQHWPRNVVSILHYTLLWISEHNIVFVICSMVKRKCVIYVPLASLNGIAKILILFSVGMKYVSVCVFLRGVKWTAGRYHAHRSLTASLQWFLRASAVRAASQTPALSSHGPYYGERWSSTSTVRRDPS